MSERDTAERAALAVRDALDGKLGENGVALAQLFRESADRGRRCAEQLAGIEREANALAAVLADVLDAAVRNDELRRVVDAVVDDLPQDARVRVIAYRHQSATQGSPWSWHGWTQHGRLPKVPPRASVMRDRVRVVDADVVSSPDDRVMSSLARQQAAHPPMEEQ